MNCLRSAFMVLMATNFALLACVTSGDAAAFLPMSGRYRYQGPHAVQDVQVVSSAGAWVLVFLRSDAGVPPYCELRASVHACEQALSGRELVSLLVQSDSGVVDFTSGSYVLPDALRVGEFWRHGSADGGVLRRIVDLNPRRVVVVTEEIQEGGHTEELLREEFERGIGLRTITYANGPSVRVFRIDSELPRDAG